MDCRGLSLLVVLLGIFCLTPVRSGAAPSATIDHLQSGQVRLSWPSAEAGWEVEETAALGTGASWSA
jgi:hypothetical protein